ERGGAGLAALSCPRVGPERQPKQEPADERDNAGRGEGKGGRRGVWPELRAGEILSHALQRGARGRQRLRSRPLEHQDPGKPQTGDEEDVVEHSRRRGHDRYQRRGSACSNAPSAALSAMAKARISTSSAYMVALSKLL